MNAHVPAPLRSLPDIVAEYDRKNAGLDAAYKRFQQAGDDLKMAATVGGTFGQENLEIRAPWDTTLKKNLIKSAWLHVYDGLNIKILASPSEKRLFEQSMAAPPDFTLDNIRGTFGKYILDPRGSILRGLAEVFCGLDQAYKSHDKVKIGVAGLPKRIILSNVGSYGSYGRERLIALLNALAAYQGKPLIEHKELEKLDSLHRVMGHVAGTVDVKYPGPLGPDDKPLMLSRGVTVKKFQNGNAHIVFDQATLTDINKALAEFYGNVLCDTTDEKPTQKQASTEVSKDLQFYPTPQKVIDGIIADYTSEFWKDKKVLEPSCGDGRIMVSFAKKGALTYGIEVDAGRAEQARRRGCKVLTANFLQTVPEPKFDFVVMNPPFYGRHYAKHVDHAMKFLVPGGTLIAILPATARYDHGLVDGRWEDLPVGSFSESGTNINTCILTKHARHA
jgi:hypothetical protein